MQNPRGRLKFIFLPASAARGSINGIALHPSEPNPGWGWTWGDLGTIQPQSNAGSDPAGGDTERKSHQRPAPWAKRSDGRRLFGSKMTVWKEEGLQWPQKTRRLFSLERQTDTPTLAGAGGHLFGSALAMLPAAAPGGNAVPAGLGCPSLQLGINRGNDTRLLLGGFAGAATRCCQLA